MHYFLQVGNVKKYFNESQLFSLIFACLICDYNHPYYLFVSFAISGFSNRFLIKTKHPLALRYNGIMLPHYTIDQSVLENYHCSSVFALLKEREDLNVIKLQTKAGYRKMRRLVVETVLATDLSQHFALLNKLKTKLEGDVKPKTEEEVAVLFRTTV